MRFLVLLFFVCFFSNFSSAQLAIINDKDGYVNVREEKTTKSDIIGRVFDGDIFMVASDYDTDNWWNIFYSTTLSQLEQYKKNYYVETLNYNSENIYIQGYIHKSRFILIENIPSISKEHCERTSNSVVIENDSIVLQIETAAFNEKKHTIKKNQSGFVVSIDNLEPKGVDGSLPNIEITNLSLSINNKIINFEKSHFIDLYEPNLELINLHFDSNGNWILYMPYNSDGAGGYFAAWLIKDNVVVRRYVDSL